METTVQLKGEKWASKWASKESELDRLVRMATQQERKEALVPGDAPLVQTVDYLIDEAIRMRSKSDWALGNFHHFPKSFQKPLILRVKDERNASPRGEKISFSGERNL